MHFHVFSLMQVICAPESRINSTSLPFTNTFFVSHLGFSLMLTWRISLLFSLNSLHSWLFHHFFTELSSAIFCCCCRLLTTLDAVVDRATVETTLERRRTLEQKVYPQGKYNGDDEGRRLH
ncbi:hypothetical protein ACQ4LE_000125 [Meloidogyne hapla]